MNIKSNNKGLSLMELLIAIAIAAVVSTLIATMIASSSSMFRKESNKIDVQNDMQIVQNKIADALRQAKSISVVKCGDSIRIYTGPINTSTNQLTAEYGSETSYPDCIITYENNTLYVTSSYMETIPKGYILSENVTDFDITLSEDPIGYTEKATVAGGGTTVINKSYYANPLTVELTIRIGTGQEQKNADMMVKVRNKIKTYEVYTPSTFNMELSGVTPTKYELR